MKNHRRTLILFSIILLSIFVLTTVLAPLAEATSLSRQKTFNEFSLPSLKNITPLSFLHNNHITDNGYIHNLTSAECNVPQNYPDIQLAVDEPTCDLVNVAAGTFFENVVMDRDVTIQGAGINSTIVDGNDNGSVFEVLTGAIVTITNMSISNGFAEQGGGIDNAGNVTLITCTVSNNFASNSGGGIRNEQGGIVNLSFSTLRDNSAGWGGGGISNESGSIVNLSHSILSHNSADFGGGINGSGIVNVSFSTLSDNSADYDGGGIRFGSGLLNLSHSALSHNSAGAGGGINNSYADGVITVSNSVIYSNTAGAGGGIFNDSGQILVENSTISGNTSSAFGGGLHNMGGGQVAFAHSTFSGNAAPDGANISGDSITHITSTILARGVGGTNCGGSVAVTSGGYNLSDDDSCELGETGDLNNTNTLLGPLADNGGYTLTHMPHADSPAIDAGDPLNCPPTDQRGVPRPYDEDGDCNAVCDIGSVEYHPPSPLSVVIQGPITGDVQTNYTFTAVATPISVTQPIIYVWQTAEQSSITHTSGITDTAVFSWNTSGANILTVTANNSVSSTTACTIVTTQFVIYLPIVNKP